MNVMDIENSIMAAGKDLKIVFLPEIFIISRHRMSSI